MADIILFADFSAVAKGTEKCGDTVLKYEACTEGRKDRKAESSKAQRADPNQS